MPRGMWDLPGPGIKPVSPALAGGFFTTEPPGKLLPFWGGGGRSGHAICNISGIR